MPNMGSSIVPSETRFSTKVGVVLLPLTSPAFEPDGPRPTRYDTASVGTIQGGEKEGHVQMPSMGFSSAKPYIHSASPIIWEFTVAEPIVTRSLYAVPLTPPTP